MGRMLSEYVKVFCALYLYCLNTFEIAVSGGRIYVVDWNGWLASSCWWRRRKDMQEEWQQLCCAEWHSRKDKDGSKGGAKVAG